jgi:hypothetical protein
MVSISLSPMRAATVFGELWRLEPLAPARKAMWTREMEWLLSVADSIVELTPSIQELPEGGGQFEVMVPRPRSDLYMNLPALKKLDAMLLAMIDGFKETEFWYVDRGIMVEDSGGPFSSSSSSCSRPSVRQEEKWWLPCPRVPPKGLSEEGRRKLQQGRDCANQILKAAMAINSDVLAEMEIPEVYLETLPKVNISIRRFTATVLRTIPLVIHATCFASCCIEHQLPEMDEIRGRFCKIALKGTTSFRTCL